MGTVAEFTIFIECGVGLSQLSVRLLFIRQINISIHFQLGSNPTGIVPFVLLQIVHRLPRGVLKQSVLELLASPRIRKSMQHIVIIVYLTETLIQKSR